MGALGRSISGVIHMESLANVREHELEELGQPFRDGPFETSINLTSR